MANSFLGEKRYLIGRDIQLTLLTREARGKDWSGTLGRRVWNNKEKKVEKSQYLKTTIFLKDKFLLNYLLLKVDQ